MVRMKERRAVFGWFSFDSSASVVVVIAKKQTITY